MRNGGRRGSMARRKDFDTHDAIWVDFAQFIDIFDGGAHVDGEVGIGAARVTLNLLCDARDRRGGRTYVGHIEDGGIATGQRGACAVWNILFMLQPRLAQMSVYLDQTR